MQDRILPSHFYQPLIELLLNSVRETADGEKGIAPWDAKKWAPEYKSSCVLDMLEEVRSLNHIETAQILVRLFLGRGKIEYFMDYLIERDIENCQDPRSLFLSSTMATEALKYFIKLVGQPYLNGTLKEAMEQIFSESRDVELEVARICGKKNHEAILESSIATMRTYLINIMEAILNSVSKCPVVIRRVFQRLLKQCERKWAGGSAMHFFETIYEDAKCSFITNFVVGNFFAAAVANPKLFLLRENHPSAKVGKILNFLSKSLLMIASSSEDGIEEWAEPLETLISDYRSRSKEWVEVLVTDIPSEVTDGASSEKRGSLGSKRGSLGGIPVAPVDGEEEQKWKSMDTLSSGSSEIGNAALFYHRHLIIQEGNLHKCSAKQINHKFKIKNFKLRYFKLTPEVFSYAKNANDQTRVSIPTSRICCVELVDEDAFAKDNVFQMIISDQLQGNNPDAINEGKEKTDKKWKTLYLQAKNVNELNHWISSIRKTCISNRDLLKMFHPGIFRKVWTCCLKSEKTAEGCNKAVRQAVLGDWKDPLNSDVEAQAIFIQLNQGKDRFRQSYVESRDASILVHSCYPEGEMDEEMDEMFNSTKTGQEDQVSEKKPSSELLTSPVEEDEERDVVSGGWEPKPISRQRSPRFPPRTSIKKNPLTRNKSYYDNRMTVSAQLLDIIADLAKAHHEDEVEDPQSTKAFLKQVSISSSYDETCHLFCVR